MSKHSFNFSNTPLSMLSECTEDKWKFIRLNNLWALQLDNNNSMGNTPKRLKIGEFEIGNISFENSLPNKGLQYFKYIMF